ncbi:MuDRA-like transposase [Cucumis melo var. makuwa]|uniref:MuDRA-like transposase n=1 Tax=Cucumis melo var. makuwa TaxID=1194695 RepID=A0A5A7SKY6_CUCMM|nr:MuDRA-like transposase [Cucumis melo var. makuwa]
MAHVRILMRHGGAWDEGRRKYEGVLKGIVVPKEITHKDLQYELYDLAEVDPTKFDIKIRCIYEIKEEKEAPPFELSNDRDLKFIFLVKIHWSTGSNQVQNLNPHPLIGMDTLDENEVDIGEVQVDLCDNMIGTNSAIWESYESYHSKDDTFTLESVEMYNELFDIPEQRDAPTKDCKGKGELIKSKFKGPGRIYKPRDIIEYMRQDYDINMSYEKAWRARENAYERVRGSPEESYNLLRRYGEALKFTNPGFLNYIRPIIVMDGTFLKNKYREAWRHLLAFPNGSGKYLNDVGIARWSRVHYPGRRYNMMTTNIVESMNSILKEPRDLSIALFLENVRALLLQRWFWMRREEGIKVTSTLTKWAELVIQKKQERALTMKVNPIDCYQFHVKDLDKEEVVNLQTKECTCKKFQAEQLPCSHAVYPVGNQSYWKTSEDYVHMTVLPPKVVKRVGRPKKKRIPSVGEAPKLHKMVVPSDKYFPATVSCKVHKIGSLIKDKLTKEQLQMFDKTIFGPLLNVNMVFNDVEYYFNTAVGDYDQIPGWGDVNYVISCINIKEHWLAIAVDMRKCKIYVFDSMPNYVEQKLVDEALQMPTRCIASLAIAIGVNLYSDHFTYGPWPIRRSKATLQKGRSLDCEIFCSKFVECLVTGSDLSCLTVPNMKLFRQQYVMELWANKYFC